MTPEILAPIILVVVVGGGILYTQALAPLLARRKLGRVLALGGWRPVAGDDEPAWLDVMALAIEGNAGGTRAVQHDERFGPITVHFERSEKRFGRALSVHRNDGLRRARYVGCGLRRTRVDSRTGRVLQSRRRRWSRGLELWIGEAVPWAVAEPELVFSAAAEMFGEAARAMAAAREVNPEQIPELRSPSADNPSAAMREALRRTPTAQHVFAEVFVGPRAWVMTVPLGRGTARLEELLELASEVSAVVDGAS